MLEDHNIFINWFGNQKGEGFEFQLLLMEEEKYAIDSVIKDGIKNS